MPPLVRRRAEFCPSRLPRRIVLRATEVTDRGLALALALQRAKARKRNTPIVVAVEIDPRIPLHLAVLAHLLIWTDPTRETVLQVRALGTRRPPHVPNTTRTRVSHFARCDDRSNTIARLGDLLSRRQSRNTALVCLVRSFEVVPRTEEDCESAARSVAAAMRVLAPGEEQVTQLALQSFQSFALRRPPPLRLYKETIRRITEPVDR